MSGSWRRTPRWSRPGAVVESACPIAGLPASSATVFVGPPFCFDSVARGIKTLTGARRPLGREQVVPEGRDRVSRAVVPGAVPQMVQRDDGVADFDLHPGSGHEDTAAVFPADLVGVGLVARDRGGVQRHGGQRPEPAARSSGAVVGDRRIDELDVAVPGAEATPVRSGNVSAEGRAVDEETACALREIDASRLARRPVPGDRARPDRRAPVAIEIPSSGE